MYLYTFIVFWFSLGVHYLLVAGTLIGATYRMGQDGPRKNKRLFHAPQTLNLPIRDLPAECTLSLYPRLYIHLHKMNKPYASAKWRLYSSIYLLTMLTIHASIDISSMYLHIYFFYMSCLFRKNAIMSLPYLLLYLALSCLFAKISSHSSNINLINFVRWLAHSILLLFLTSVYIMISSRSSSVICIQVIC